MKITLGELATLLRGNLEGPAENMISDLKGIEDAGPSDLAFLADPKFAEYLPGCRAGVVLVRPGQKVPEGLNVIRVPDPHLAFAQILTHATRKPYVPLGVHPKAVVEESAVLGGDVSVHALAYVGKGARLGDRVILHPGVYVGPGAQVGDDSELRPNVVLHDRCLVGKRCLIHTGSVIGADGYGFVPDGEGYFKIPQVGIVQIDDDVEIGALNTIDRAATQRTWIRRGVKTDNMVHVAHNCEIGEDTLLVAQTGIAGSTILGRHVVLGGKVGVAGHLKLGDNVSAAGGSSVYKSLSSGEVVGGKPAMPISLWKRTNVLVRKLPELFSRVRSLEKRLAGLRK